MKAKKDLEKLHQLILSLSSAELELVKKVVTNLKSNFNKINLQEELFILLCNKSQIEYEYCKEKVSEDGSDETFIRVINKLRNRIEETLIYELNINRADNFSIAFKSKIKQKKILLAAYILQTRGLISLAQERYNKVIQIGKRYEHYDDLLEALYLKQGLLGLSKGKKAYNKMSDQITFYEDCRISLYSAKDWYRSYYAEVDFKGVKGKKSIELLQKYINDLKNSFQYTQSDNIRMYQFLLEMELYQQLNNYQLVDQIGNQFAIFIQNSKAAYGKQRLIGVYYQLAENQLKLIEFKEILNYCNIGLESFISKNINYYNLKELEIEALFHLGHYDQLIETIQEITNENFYIKVEFRRTKLRYFLGVIYFIKGEYKLAKTEFNDTAEFEKDKEGWNLWIRIMRILCDIETFKNNFVEYDIESFRKYIERSRQQLEVRPRDQLILKALIALGKNQFHFKETYRKEADLFGQLESMNDNARWRVDSPELIIFHQWFLAKMIKINYKADYEEYRLNAVKNNSNLEDLAITSTTED